MKYVIKDWAGNECLTNTSFDSFDAAWDYILAVVDDESELQEYSAIEIA